MSKTRLIHLQGTVPSSPSVQFLDAEIPESRSPFAMIWYSLRGARQEYALRLDVDKGVFLDRLEDKMDDEFIRQASPKIVDRLSYILYKDVG